MARPKKPASVTTGHTQSRSELEARMAQEKKMKGASDLIDSPPSIIAMDDTAIEFYHLIVSMLRDADILSNLDRYSVGLLADSLAKLQHANENIKEEGMKIWTFTKTGEKQVLNPIYPIYKDSLNNFSKLATQFGLTPSSRASLSDIALQQRKEDSDPFMSAINSLNDEQQKKVDSSKDS